VSPCLVSQVSSGEIWHSAERPSVINITQKNCADPMSDPPPQHVLERLDPKDCAMLAQVAKPWLEVMAADNLPRAGKAGSVQLKVVDFVESVEMMQWAKANGCPWHLGTCAKVAIRGHLDVLKWARKHGCPWSTEVCTPRGAGT